MFYTETLPPESLRRVLRCIWILRGPADAGAERILPDGCPELILHRGDHFRELDACGFRAQPRELLVGPLSTSLTIEPTGVIDMLGIRFQPTGLAALGLPPATVAGQRVDLGDALPRLHRALVDAVAPARGDAARVTAVLEVLAQHCELPHHVTPAELAVRSIFAHHGNRSVAELARDLERSPRQLERDFRGQVGLTPKRLARIVRFQHAYRRAEHDWHTERLDGARLAADCGYYDQAHLLRDFRDFARATPGQHFQEDRVLAALFAGGQPRSPS